VKHYQTKLAKWPFRNGYGRFDNNLDMFHGEELNANIATRPAQYYSGASIQITAINPVQSRFKARAGANLRHGSSLAQSPENRIFPILRRQPGNEQSALQH
jgi:hypothetical protein